MLVGVVAKIRNGTLLQYRQNNGVTQKQAALLCGVSFSIWNAVECMRFSDVAWIHIKTIAEALDVVPDDICPPELRKKNLRLEATAFRETEVALLLAHDAKARLELPSPEQLLLDKERDELTREAIDRALRRLTYRERQVIEVRYCLGPNNGTHKTLRQVGTEIGASAERVRQLEEKALDKLRLPCHHLEKLLE